MKAIADKELELSFIRHVLSTGEENNLKLNAELTKETITKECFTDPFLWDVFQAAKSTSKRCTLGVAEVASVLGPESWTKLNEVWPTIPRNSSIGVLAGKLREYSSRRAAVHVAQRIILAANGGGDDFGESLIRAAASLQAAYAPDGAGVINGKEALHSFYEDLERAQTGNHSFVFRTGIEEMDRVIGGLPRGFLSIIGAYPGCFKSGIMATIAANLAEKGHKVGFFSLEDSPTWLAKRYVSRATGIAVQDLARRRLSQYELTKVAETQDSVVRIVQNLYIDGRTGLSGFDVSASARYMIAERKCEVIIIDHIGEMQARKSRKDRYDLEVAENVRAIRDTAKDTGCAVLMASHLRRRGDSEEDIYRVPKMTDFSDSSSIEKMCRLAMGLYQPQDDASVVAIKVLKMNEGSGRGQTFQIEKDEKSALVKNGVFDGNTKYQ